MNVQHSFMRCSSRIELPNSLGQVVLPNLQLADTAQGGH